MPHPAERLIRLVKLFWNSKMTRRSVMKIEKNIKNWPFKSFWGKTRRKDQLCVLFRTFSSFSSSPFSSLYACQPFDLSLVLSLRRIDMASHVSLAIFPSNKPNATTIECPSSREESFHHVEKFSCYLSSPCARLESHKWRISSTHHGTIAPIRQTSLQRRSLFLR